MNKQRVNTYNRVMPRVYDRSRTSLSSVSKVTRHEKPSSVSVGAKESSLNVNSAGVFRELPTVLNDYVPESSRDTVKKSSVVRPRRTIKSQDPAKSPQSVSKGRSCERPRHFRTGGSTASVVNRASDKWSDSNVRQCYSSRSHTKLKELKEEIKAYQSTEKLMKIRSQLYKNCGVVFDDVGQVAVDKAVQAEDTEPEPEVIRRKELRQSSVVLEEPQLGPCLVQTPDHIGFLSQLQSDSIYKTIQKKYNESTGEISSLTPQKRLEQCTCAFTESANNTQPCQIHTETPGLLSGTPPPSKMDVNDVHSNVNNSKNNESKLDDCNDTNIKLNDSTLTQVPIECSSNPIQIPRRRYKKKEKIVREPSPPIPEKRPRKPYKPFILERPKKKPKSRCLKNKQQIEHPQNEARKSNNIAKDEFDEFAAYIAAKLRSFPIAEASTLKTYLKHLVDDFERTIKRNLSDNADLPTLVIGGSCNDSHTNDNDITDTDNENYYNDDGNEESDEEEVITDIVIKEEVEVHEDPLLGMSY